MHTQVEQRVEHAQARTNDESHHQAQVKEHPQQQHNAKNQRHPAKVLNPDIDQSTHKYQLDQHQYKSDASTLKIILHRIFLLEDAKHYEITASR
jgi:hypothetical protein